MTIEAPQTHPSIEVKLRYLLMMLDATEQARLEDHLRVCSRCHADMEGMRMGFEMALEEDEGTNKEQPCTPHGR